MSVPFSTVGSSPPLGVFPPHHRVRIIVSMVAMTLLSSCSGGTTDVPEDTEGREAFIGAYLDLRIAAMSLLFGSCATHRRGFRECCTLERLLAATRDVW